MKNYVFRNHFLQHDKSWGDVSACDKVMETI